MNHQYQRQRISVFSEDFGKQFLFSKICIWTYGTNTATVIKIEESCLPDTIIWRNFLSDSLRWDVGTADGNSSSSSSIGRIWLLPSAFSLVQPTSSPTPASLPTLIMQCCTHRSNYPKYFRSFLFVIKPLQELFLLRWNPTEMQQIEILSPGKPIVIKLITIQTI